MHRSGERGIVLVLVLWLTILVGIIAASFVLAARTEGLQARHTLDSARARYAAEAGLHRAAFELRNPDPNTRWVGDGRDYHTELDGATITIRIYDETGKIDLNAADELTLRKLFESLGRSEREAQSLTGAILDWRDPDDLKQAYGAERDDYRAAERRYGPRNRPFETVAELQQVLGMDYELFLEVEPLVTIYSGRSQPNPAFSPAAVLRAWPSGMSAAQVEQFIQMRTSAPPGQPLVLPDGTAVLAQGGGLSYTIEVGATLANGATAQLEATLQIGPGSIPSRPFRVLRWRDGPPR